MKTLKPLLFALVAFTLVSALITPPRAAAAVFLSDGFADGNSTVQDLPNNSLAVYKARSATVRRDAVGSVEYDMTGTGTNSEAFWAYFTNSGSPVNLGVGDAITFSGTFSLQGIPFAGAGDIRFGLLNSNGSRVTADKGSGQSDNNFADDTGYGAQFFAGGTGSPFALYRKDASPTTNIFNSMGTTSGGLATGWSPLTGAGASARQSLVNNTSYTFSYSVSRISATQTRVMISVTGGSLSGLNYTATETSSTPNTSFDWFSMRVAGTNFAAKMTFTRFLVDYSPAAPEITTQPAPSSQTVAVGSNVQFSVGATGNDLSYQWRKNANPVDGATGTSLQLQNVQTVDTGAYDVVVSNAGGSTTSSAVALTVSDGPVEPAPIITAQPQNTVVTVNSLASLSVTAAGNGLFYQWFKNGALIHGASGSALQFPSAQIADAADYTVTVSNGGGGVTSNPARLTVVSAMTVTAFEPLGSAANICADTPLRLTFNQTPRVGNSGKIHIHKADGVLVDTIDLASASQSKNIGGVNFNYYPLLINGNTVLITPHVRLGYNTTYYVTMEAGVIKDAANAPFAGFSDPNIFRFTTKAAPAAGANVLTVAANGTGDFCTVQGAIDSIPANNTQRVIVDVRNGNYVEIVLIPSNKPFVTVRGESRGSAVIQYPNNNNLNPSTVGRALFGVEAPDFNLENITLYNTTPQGGSQAEALRTNGLRANVIRTNLKSFQDTLLTSKSAFVTDSYIEGDVDFMWGNGATYFKNTELKMLREGLGYYTQIRNNTLSSTGNVYVNCKLTRGANVTNGSYLSRIDPNSFPYSQVVFIDTQMDSHIRPVGWQLDNAVSGQSYPNIRFWEYNTTDLNGNPADCSQRNSVSRNNCRNPLSADDVAFFRNPANVIGYTPQEKLTALVALSNLTHTFDGTAKTANVVTNPAGLAVNVTYNGSATPPVNAGNYTVVATVNDANYYGTATGTMVINPAPTALITLGSLNHLYDGTPKPATATTNPAGLNVNLSYDGSTEAPINAGSYVVTATISDTNYVGSATGKLNIFPNGPKAFPEAEGYGAYAKGGRGGDVYRVTNLNDAGAGSLREGVRTAPATGRTIVFDVSGTIYLQSRLNINKPFLTLAGQTAPGDGITVAGETTVINNTHNIIVRYMRFRAGDLRCANGFEGDSLWIDGSTDVIIDHVSASWSVDETLSVTSSNRVTVQWSLITESLKLACHDKGTHGYGSLLRYGNGSYTFHHNLYAHHLNRSPRIGDNLSVDFVNNVVYDWTSNAGYSGEASEGTPKINYINNYFVAGRSTTSSSARNRAFSGGSANTLIYQDGNMIDSNVNGARDGANTGWAMITGAYTRQMTPFDFPAVTADDATTAYNRVLEKAGSSIARDTVDTRVLSQIQNDSGTQINTQTEVGGFPTLNSLPALLDSDKDGMPNNWEITRNLNPFDATDGRVIAANGYSNLENYLNKVNASPINAAPIAENDAAKTDEDVPVTIDAIANDIDTNGDRLTLAAVGNPAHGTVEIVNGAAVYTPSANFSGKDSFVYTVTDGVAEATGTVTLTINPINDAPLLSSVPVSAAIDELNTYSFTATASDVDSAQLVFSLVNAPVGATIDPATGQFIWTPSEEQGGTGAPYHFKVRVSDEASATETNITLSVKEVNQAPVLNAIGGKTVLFGSTLTFNAVGIDGDVPVQTLTYSLTGTIPAGAAIDLASGAFTWTPDVSQIGAVYTFNVRVTDSDGVFAQQAVVVGVAYEWSNFLAPLNNGGTSFNLNRIIPVKFKLTAASANIGNAKAHLLIAPVVGGIIGTESPATASGSFNSGNLFRYDAAEKQYIFNFSTRNLKAGTYQLRVDLGDGVNRTLRITLE